jgi:hypothetical protein
MAAVKKLKRDGKHDSKMRGMAAARSYSRPREQ